MFILGVGLGGVVLGFMSSSARLSALARTDVNIPVHTGSSTPRNKISRILGSMRVFEILRIYDLLGVQNIYIFLNLNACI